MMGSKEQYIRLNIEQIRQKIEIAAQKSGRGLEDIKIVAVTKTVDADTIKIALEDGLLDLGESKVQEISKKFNGFTSNYKLHFIGHLQKNKVKYIIDKVYMIHSLDSFQLAEEINKQAKRANKLVDVLVEVNISGEESKYGISKEEVLDFMYKIKGMEAINVRGLMTVAPLRENSEENRWVFSQLRKISIDIKKEKIDNISMEYLSMGMSNDFEVAIEEGANIVRIGRAIFGERDY